MFDKIRNAITALTSGSSPVVVTTSGSAAVAAPATTQGTRADLIEIKVNGLDAAKQSAVWLTKGRDRTQPATAVRLVDCTTDHLKNIVANKPDLSSDYLRIIESILADRGEILPANDFSDTDDDPNGL